MSVLYVLAKAFVTKSRRDRIRHTIVASRQPVRLNITILEDRLAPALLTISSLADGPISAASSKLTLREAIVLIDTGGTATDSSGNGLAAAKASQINTASPFGVNDIIQFAPNLFGSAQPQIVLEDGSLLVDHDVVINGPGASQVAVSGNNESTVFEIAAGATVQIADLLIEAGAASGNSGGGIVSGGTLTLTNTVVSGNTAVLGAGGGIFNSGTLTLIDSAVSGNTSRNDGGLDNSGALTLIDSNVSGNTAIAANGGLANYGGTLALIDSTISGNTAEVVGGLGNYFSGTATLLNSSVSGNTASIAAGGIYNMATLTLTDSTVSDNHQTNGGGILNTGTLTQLDSTISDNKLAPGTGGGVLNGGTLTLVNSDISGNAALNDGGLSNSGTLTLIDSRVSGNTAIDGNGGLANYGGTLTLVDSTVSGNTASAAGGLGNYDNGTTTLLNSTVSGNSAGFAGGILNAATMTLTDSTVSDNTASQGNGGGIFSTDTLTLVNSTVSGNVALTDSDLDNMGTLTVIDPTATGNTPATGEGGLTSDSNMPTLVDGSGSPADHGTGPARIASDNAPSFVGSIFDAVALTRTDFSMSNNTDVLDNNGGTSNTPPLTLVNNTALENDTFTNAAALLTAATTGGVISGVSIRKDDIDAQTLADSDRFAKRGDDRTNSDMVQETMPGCGQVKPVWPCANPAVDAKSNNVDNGAEWFDFKERESFLDQEPKLQASWTMNDLVGLLVLLLAPGGCLLEEPSRASLKCEEDCLNDAPQT